MASASNIVITVAGALDYKLVKSNYFAFLEKQADLFKVPSLLTREGIEEKIKQITLHQTETQKFFVKIVKGKKKLYVKKSETIFLEILPVEEAFDVLLKIHIVGQHCNALETFHRVSQVYSVPIFCSRWIVQSCNVCNPSGIPKQTQDETGIVEPGSNNLPRGLWRLNIIKDDCLPPTGRVCFLLILKEDTTNFLVLRPIYESAEELALDLLKLFCEFGYPEKVCVPNMIIFYETVFHLVYLINPLVKITVEEVTNSDVFETDEKEVLNEIQNWTNMMDDKYWEQSCHIVQYKLNTTKKVFTRLYSQEDFVGIPFHEFFNYRFRSKMTWIAPPNLKNRTNTASPLLEENTDSDLPIGNLMTDS